MWKPEPWIPVREIARWHVTTQYGARRNAMLASTALAQRRKERHEAEQFLSRMNPRDTPLPQASDRQLPMSP